MTRLAFTLLLWGFVEHTMQHPSDRSRLDAVVLWGMRLSAGTQLAYAAVLAFVVVFTA